MKECLICPSSNTNGNLFDSIIELFWLLTYQAYYF